MSIIPSDGVLLFTFVLETSKKNIKTYFRTINIILSMKSFTSRKDYI